jgi:hypothetical protein
MSATRRERALDIVEASKAAIGDVAQVALPEPEDERISRRRAA